MRRLRPARSIVYMHAYRVVLVLALLVMATACAADRPAVSATPKPSPTAAPGKKWNVRLVNSQGEAIELQVPVARSQAEVEKGLSGITQLPGDGGMLFVFPNETRTPFWMKDTLVPLSIAFIGGDGRIVDIQEMEALSLTLHVSSGSFKYALEMGKGFYASHGVKVGDQATVRLP